MTFSFITNDTKRALQTGADAFTALSNSQAIIAFDPDGTVLDATEQFLAALGYRLDEIKGRHHSMFVDPTYAATAEYKAFWERLAQGKFQARTFKRIGKGCKDVWIEASYNPLLDA